MFCKHSWKILSEVTTDSNMEKLNKLGYTISNPSTSWVTRKLIQTVTCTKCGKLVEVV